MLQSFTMSEALTVFNRRKFVRKTITQYHNKISEFSTYDNVKRISTRNGLMSQKSKLDELNDKYQELSWTGKDSVAEATIDSELSICYEYQVKIDECLANLEVLSNNVQSGGLLKKRVAPLPKYSGNADENQSKFFFHFEEVVNKFSYTDYEKLLLLKEQLSGRALTLVESLEIENQGYDKAKDLLVKALASPELQKFNCIKSLTETKFDKSNPFQFISKLKNSIDCVNKLKLTSDDFIQYFAWQNLSEDFRVQLVSITNKTRPSLQDIVDNFFVANERCPITKKKEKVEEKCTEMAAGVSYSKSNFKSNPKSNSKLNSNSKSKSNSEVFDKQNVKKESFTGVPCKLCDKEAKSHLLKDCEKYNTSKLRFDRLLQISGCTRCGYINHTIVDCTFKLSKRCFDCKQWHWTFICPNKVTDNSSELVETCNENSDKFKSLSQNSVKKKEKSKTGKTNAGLSCTIDAYKSCCDENTILPTFTCEIAGHEIRALKDSGCQSNLILESLSDELSLEIVNNDINLTIKGINGSQRYNTKMVKLNLKIGVENYSLNAICIPKINVELELNMSSLHSIVDKFQEKGYTLADNYLTEFDIDNVGLILGSKSSYCIPEKEIVFGKNNNSIFSVTPHGVLLKGDIDLMLKDLEYLEGNNSSFESNSEINNKFCNNTNSLI